MDVEAIVTHSGAFHADDLLSYAVLDTLMPGLELVRTRDGALIDEMEPRSITFDVGDVFDPNRRRFDHHQPDKPRREDGIPYSSFGLIWREHGLAFVEHALGLRPDADPDLARSVHARVDETFVRDIDATDNGHLAPDQSGLMHHMALPSILMLLTPDAVDGVPPTPAEEDAAFVTASGTARVVLHAFVRKTRAAIEAELLVRAAIAKRTHPNVIELPRMMPYLETVLAAGDGARDILYVLAPGPDEWIVSAINVGTKSFESRRPLPASWAGLRGTDLEDASGIDGARFCHTARFVGIAESRGAALDMIEASLAS